MQEAINRILDRYLVEKKKSFANNKLADYLRGHASETVQKVVDSKYPGQFKVSASAGQGRWAEIPWIGVFDKEITESPMRGYFVMYFFRSDMSRVFLSLNQGWMFFRDTYGLELAKEKISTAARAYRKLLGPIGQFGYESISLGTERELGTGYELGHICGKRYERGAIPDDETLRRDLLDIVDIYRRLKTIIGTEAIEERVKAIIVEQEKIPDISGEEILEIPEKIDLESVTEVVAGESKFIDRVGDDLNTREVSERAKLSGVETEKYLSALEKAGFFSSEIVDGERFYPVESPALVAKLAAFSGQGFSIEEAIEIIKGGGAIEAKKLKDLEKKVEKLSNNVDSLSAQLQGYLSKVNQQTEKKGFCYHFKAAFKSLGKKKS